MTTRTYKTADEALEAANKEVARLQYEWDMQRYSVFGVPIDKDRLNKPKQFAYEKPEPTTEPVIDLSQLVAGDKVRLRCGEICIVSHFNKHELEYPLITNFRGYNLRFNRNGKAIPSGALAIMLSIHALNRMTEADFQIVEIVRPRGKMEQITITNWPETLKPDWEPVGVDRDGSVKPVGELTYMQPPKLTTPETAHPLLDFPSVYASVQIEG